MRVFKDIFKGINKTFKEMPVAMTLFTVSYLFAETQRQFEQLLDEVQFLAALIQETQQLAHIEASGVLPDQRPSLYNTPEVEQVISTGEMMS